MEKLKLKFTVELEIPWKEHRYQDDPSFMADPVAGTKQALEDILHDELMDGVKYTVTPKEE